MKYLIVSCLLFSCSLTCCVWGADRSSPQIIKEAIVTVRWQAAADPAATIGAQGPAGVRLFWQSRSDATQPEAVESSAASTVIEGETQSGTTSRPNRTAIAIAGSNALRSTYIPSPAQATGLVVQGRILTVLDSTARNSPDLKVVDHSGAERTAKVVAWDAATDLTVLELPDDAPELSAELSIADEIANWGDEIRIAHHWKVGNPALVMGIVSTTPEFDAKMRALAFDVDAKISLHAVGAPVLNSRFEVVGIVIAPRTESAMPAAGIAVGIDSIEQLLNFVSAGHTGQLTFPIIGASLREREEQVVIQHVLKQAPAEEAGLRAGDHILSIDGQPVKRVSQVIEKVTGHSVGDILHFKVVRDSEQLDYQVELREFQADTAPAMSESVRATYLFPPNFYLNLPNELTEEQRSAIRQQTQTWIFNTPPAVPLVTTTPLAPDASREAKELKSQLQQVTKELAEIRSMLKELKDRP